MPPFGRCARRRLHGAVAVLGLAALASVAGCAPAAATVSGQVTLDGAPLEDANISFVPKAGGQKQAGWATIAGGEYAIPASAGLGTGAFRVEIRAPPRYRRKVQRPHADQRQRSCARPVQQLVGVGGGRPAGPERRQL